MISLNNSGIHFCKKKHEIWRICWQLVIFLYAMHGRQYLKLLLIDHANQYKGVKSKIKYPKSPHIWFRIERIGPEVARFLFYEGGLKSAGKDNTGWVCRSWWHAV